MRAILALSLLSLSALTACGPDISGIAQTANAATQALTCSMAMISYGQAVELKEQDLEFMASMIKEAKRKKITSVDEFTSKIRSHSYKTLSRIIKQRYKENSQEQIQARGKPYLYPVETYIRLSMRSVVLLANEKKVFQKNWIVKEAQIRNVSDSEKEINIISLYIPFAGKEANSKEAPQTIALCN